MDAILPTGEASDQRIHTMSKTRMTIGDAVDQAIKETSEEWFSLHLGMRSREEAAAEDITLISSTVELRKGGALQVFVGVTTRRHDQHLHNWFRFQRTGGSGYVRVEVTEPKR
jgi:hypothetical protein